MEKKCENCKWYKKISLIEKICTNENNLVNEGWITTKLAYRHVQATSSCNLFTPISDNNFKW